ncbi:MAG: HD-GYP domain-containing protein [Terriglobia bacterium]
MRKTGQFAQERGRSPTIEEIQLRKGGESKIFALTAAAEKVHPYLVGHIAGVTWIAVAIAREMGLDPQALEGIRLAATGHDVGMVDVPAHISTKNAPLTAEERSAMERDPEIGYEKLGLIKSPRPLATITLEHHERHNGSGYPHGLAEHLIGLEARIIGVSDTLEAMSSNRAHKSIPGIAKAVEDLKANSGVLYDPEVASAAITVFTNQRPE